MMARFILFPAPIVFGPETEPPLFPAPTTLDEVRPLDLRTVVRGTREGRLWNEFIARYHYLGYKTLVGAQMRYAVHDRNGWPLAMLGFSTAAWKRAPRDRFIGWTPPVRWNAQSRSAGAGHVLFSAGRASMLMEAPDVQKGPSQEGLKAVAGLNGGRDGDVGSC